MENATKALIIAAAVLIAILLIAFAMKIFDSTAGTSEGVKTTMTATEIANFNRNFTQFQGKNKSPAVVKSLADKVIAHNATDKSRQVKLNGSTESNDIMEYISGLTGYNFNINVTIDSNTGLVTDVTVS